MTIILPIKQKYSQAILSGEKTFELRRKIPKNIISTIMIYETDPTQMIVGQVNVKTIYKLPLELLWERTKGKNLLSFEEFSIYFKGREFGYAYELESPMTYTHKVPLEKYGFRAPIQSFAYLPTKENKWN